MGFAPTTLNFCTVHSMAMIRGINDASFANRLEKTRPAAATFKFGITFKKRVAAGPAMISAYLLGHFKRAGSRPLSPLLAGNKIPLRTQAFFPFLFGKGYRAFAGMGIEAVLVLMVVHSNSCLCKYN